MKTFNLPMVLFSLTLLTISLANGSENSKPSLESHKHPTLVTDTRIQNICPKTRNDLLCIRTLGHFKGKPFIPTIVARLIEVAKNQAKSTKDEISDLHKEIKDEKLRLAYKTCMKKYSSAIRLLHAAKKALTSTKNLNIENVMEHASLATFDVQACNIEFDKYWPGHSSLVDENHKFQDLGSFIVEICNQTKYL